MLRSSREGGRGARVLSTLLAALVFLESLWIGALRAGAEAAPASSKPAVADGGRLAFEAPPNRSFEFSGWVGDRIRRNVEQWLLTAPLANPGMLGMFRLRDRAPAPQVMPWAGEFAGKYLISAVQALRLGSPRRDELLKHVEAFVRDLIGTQAEDGYLGPFPKQERLLGNWDLWGHYHVMQGLLLWDEVRSSLGLGAAREPVKAAIRAADLITRTYLEGTRRVYDAGSHEMNMAVIHVLGALYRRTGDDRYFRMMREIEKDWERAGDYFRAGLEGVDFYQTPRPRWESLHDVQGLVELYRITGDERYRKAFANTWRSIARRDRHNTGGFSTGEQAVGDPYAAGAIETCCTIAWMALSIDMLLLTGDPSAADELELSTFNAALGAQHPSGRWWTYNTPMDGVREASAHTIVFQARAGTPELNCCSVNGPRALGMLGEWAVLTDAEGTVVVNYYGPMRAALALGGAKKLGIVEETTFPSGDGVVHISVEPVEEVEFNLKLRIPGWSKETLVELPDGTRSEATPGSYFEIHRRWKRGDRICLQLDTRLRILPGDRAQAGRASLYRGPILLAFDPWCNRFDEGGLTPIDAKVIAGRPAPVEAPPDPMTPLSPLLLVRLPLPVGSDMVLCDFATAGAHGTRYRTWLPAANLPPPEPLLDRPRPGERVPAGKVAFAWNRGRRSPGVDEYELRVGATRDLSAALESTIVATRGRAVALFSKEKLPRETFPDGKDVFWKVTARNAHGTSESEVRSFRVDPGLPQPAEPVDLEAPEPGPDGILVLSPLHGEPKPSYGLLLDTEGIAPAPGPTGAEGTAISLDGERGRVRYAIPWFPDRDYSVAVRVATRAFPEGRIAQVFSAWAAGMDDPLRITVDGGRLFARIEAGGAWSTQGVALERGKWIHVAAVKAGSKLTLFVDGEEKASAGVPETVSSQALNVGLGGNPNYSGNEYLSASIADFALYARALSADEVRALAR